MIERLSILIGRVATLRLEDLKREEGQTTVEYSVVLVLVIAMAVAAFAALNGSITSFMSTIGTKLSAAASAV
jgi:Flp pilus assembly pilin Flp